jgi:hypothetical protein
LIQWLEEKFQAIGPGLGQGHPKIMIRLPTI